MSRDLWLKVKPAISVVKTNKIITVPAFSAACGPVNGSLYANGQSSGSAQLDIGPNTTWNYSYATNFTIALKIFLPLLSTGYTVYLYQLINSGNKAIYFYVDTNGQLNCQVYKGGVAQTLLTGGKVDQAKWCQVAVTYDGALTTGNLKLWINGEVVATSGIITSSLDAATYTNQYFLSDSLFLNIPLCYAAEFFLAHATYTKDQLLSHANGYNIPDTSVTFYFKCNDSSSLGYIVDMVTTRHLVLNSSFTTITTVYPKKLYGASFIARRYTCTSSGPVSLHPFTPTDDPNHCMCVSWLDEDSQFTIRRKLYSASEDYGLEDIAPNPEPYNGEVLPATFYLEFWNIDGLPTVDLASDLTIKTSHTNNPQYSWDHTITADLIPIGTSALAVNFPATFPLTFTAQQTFP